MKKLNLPKFLSFLLLLMLFSLIRPSGAFAYTTTYHSISISSISNGFIWNAYPHIPLGEHTVLGSVPFNLPTKESNQRSYLDMNSSLFPSHPSEGIITLNIMSPCVVYLLLASGNSFVNFEAQKIGEVTLGFGDSSTLTTDLALGENIREWCQRNSETVNTLNDPNAQSVWSDSCPGGGTGNLDMLTITLPDNFRNKILQSVKVDDTSLETVGSYDPAVNWYGLAISSESPSPLILLPGLGGSWNYENMVLGIEKPANEWYMTPGVKIYEGLIQTLQNAGYSTEGENQNLFIFNYNWTKPVNSIANDLKNYINNVVDPPEGTEIDLVGHSLGGLVARAYIQNNPDNQIDQLIAVGTPHKGAVKTYYVWEGGKLSKGLSPWQTIAAGILIHVRKRIPESNVEAIQRLAPGLKDTLPTFNYLRKGNSVKSLAQMKERNSWLENLNRPPIPDSLTSVLSNIAGLKGENTHRWIYVGYRNLLDEFLGKWVDGKPVGQVYKAGDNTVLAESARFPDDNLVELPGLNHRELIETTTGQQAIINLLGISPSEIVPAPTTGYAPLLIFQLASPATLTVYDPNGHEVGEEYPEDKLVIVRNPEEGEYRAEVNQEGSGGKFRLLIGKILPENDLWEEFEGETSLEPQIFSTHFTQASQSNKLELLNSAKERLEATREKILTSEKRIKSLLIPQINLAIRQIERIILLLQKGKEKQIEKQIERAIFSLDRLEKNLDRWQKLLDFPPEFKEELEKNLSLAEDYLVQAYGL